jgi:hypothetical protein
MLKVECIGCEDHGQSLFSLCYQNGALKNGCQNLFSNHFFQLPDLPSPASARWHVFRFARFSFPPSAISAR